MSTGKNTSRYTAYARKTRIWYICAFLLLILSLVLTNYVTTSLQRQSEQVAEANAIIYNLEQTISYTKDAETGLRGYFIMSNPAYLLPFKGSRKKVDSVFAQLQQQTASNAEQQQRLQKLKALLNKRFTLFRSAMDSFIAHDYDVRYFSTASPNNGKETMDSLRRHINRMQVTERKSIATGQQRMKYICLVIAAFDIASLVISVLLLFFAIHTFNKENKAYNEAEHKATDYRKRLEARVMELRRANLELSVLRNNEKFASTGRIARTIAHEVRNPLTNISLAAEQLEEDFADVAAAGPMLEMIRRNTVRIQHLITELLQSTRFTELNASLVAVNSLLDQSLALVADRLQASRVQVAKNYEQGLAALPADAEKLKIAFMNILVNAIDAMQPGKGTLTLKTYAADHYCYIVITDNGKGMKRETIEQLFEPYFTQKEKRIGLGLTYTQNIILNHRGFLDVESQESKGSTFTIRLPYQTSLLVTG